MGFKLKNQKPGGPGKKIGNKKGQIQKAKNPNNIIDKVKSAFNNKAPEAKAKPQTAVQKQAETKMNTKKSFNDKYSGILKKSTAKKPTDIPDDRKSTIPFNFQAQNTFNTSTNATGQTVKTFTDETGTPLQRINSNTGISSGDVKTTQGATKRTKFLNDLGAKIAKREATGMQGRIDYQAQFNKDTRSLANTQKVAQSQFDYYGSLPDVRGTDADGNPITLEGIKKSQGMYINTNKSDDKRGNENLYADNPNVFRPSGSPMLTRDSDGNSISASAPDADIQGGFTFKNYTSPTTNSDGTVTPARMQIDDDWRYNKNMLESNAFGRQWANNPAAIAYKEKYNVSSNYSELGSTLSDISEGSFSRGTAFESDPIDPITK